MEKKLYIADDHEIITQGLSHYFEQKNYDVVTFSNGTDLKKALRDSVPNALILDLNIPIINGLDILRYIHEQNINCKVIILTMYNELSLVEKCKSFGAHGYLLKTSSNEDLEDALEAHNFVYGHGVKKRSEQSRFQDQFVESTELTPREIEVIRFMAKDMNSEQIADKMHVSTHTVNTHRRNLKKKLNVSTTAGIVAFGYKNNIVE